MTYIIIIITIVTLIIYTILQNIVYEAGGKNVDNYRLPINSTDFLVIVFTVLFIMCELIILN